MIINNDIFSFKYGFKVFKNYFISTVYSSISNYFDIKFGENKYLHLSQISDISLSINFKLWIKKKQENLEFIEYENNSFISIDVFKAKKEFRTIVKDIISIISRNCRINTYFTVNSIASNVDLKMYLFGFSYYFVESLLKYDKNYKFFYLENDLIFVKTNTRKEKRIDKQSFFEYLVKENESYELEFLLDCIKSKFCLSITFDELKKNIKLLIMRNSHIYYNENREKIYGTYQLYLKELKNETITNWNGQQSC